MPHPATAVRDKSPYHTTRLDPWPGSHHEHNKHGPINPLLDNSDVGSRKKEPDDAR